MSLDEFIKEKSYEKIVLVVRRHWVTYIPTILLYTVLAFVPGALYFILLQSTPEIFQDPIPRALLILVASAYELSIALFFYASFLIYYLDMVVVTNDRLVEVSQLNLFSRSISELDLYKIQDSTSVVDGAVASIFNYGTLTIQTAGEHDEFTFEAVPNPHQLREQIMQLAEEDRKFHAHPPHTP